MKLLAWLTILPSLALAGDIAAPHQIPLGISSLSDQTPISQSNYWYETVNHNGEASFMRPPCKSAYQVFRNVVTDFGADKTGNADASTAIQMAIDGQPAIVYIPSGIYQMAKSIQMRLGTVLIGDATNPPTIKAAANFPNGQHIIYAKDPVQPGTNNFYIAIKNLIIDSTNVDKATTISHIDWTVSQATQLTNIVFNMPDFSTGHAGVTVALNYPPFPDPSGFNSGIILNDLTFNGGANGMILNGQQFVLKGMRFNRCNAGIRANGFNFVVHNSSFTDCTTGIDAHGVSGSLTVLDTIATNIGTLYAPSRPEKQFVDGEFLTEERSSALTVDGNNYFTMKPPTYREFPIDQVVNVKTITNLPVQGDGSTDDTANINSILLQSVGKVVYFPAGTYMVTDSLIIPPGSRIIGDAFASAISAASSSKFLTPNAPTAMVKLGSPGDVGVGQIIDMLFTVSDVLPGCKLLEVNMAGNQPGDVGIWNSHFRVGGAAGSKVKTACSTTPDQCMAAWGMIHLTNTSSAYVENIWGWTADHDLDGGPDSAPNPPVIAVGRGALIEATTGTWLVGTAMEHNTLYQYNFNAAANTCSVFQQSETPYWQGTEAFQLAPAPWTDFLMPSDPTFNNCESENAQCRMAWFELVNDSHDIVLYGGCVWVFFNGGVGHSCDICQQNAIGISKSTGTFLYGTNVKAIENIIISDGVDIALRSENDGSFATGGVIAAYLYNSIRG
ncbi:MAG: hypothetical protein Q9214_003796 [Letrouitia sp. 1 TL-2023]